MAYSWITPKTDWTTSTHFTYTDYNRIRNNLLFLNDKINELFPDKAKTLDLGDALTGYTDNYYPSQFNAFEDALESFTRIGQNVNIGTKGVYKGNEPFIMADALNRIEKCCLKWYNFQPFITGVTISPSTFECNIGDTQNFTVTVTPSGLPYAVVWTSSDPSIFSIDSSGHGTAIASGNVTITATIKQTGASDISATSTVAVIIPVTSISVDVDSLEGQDGNIKYANVTVLPANATHKDDWTITIGSGKTGYPVTTTCEKQSGKVKVTFHKSEGDYWEEVGETYTWQYNNTRDVVVTISADGCSDTFTITLLPSGSFEKQETTHATELIMFTLIKKGSSASANVHLNYAHGSWSKYKYGKIDKVDDRQAQYRTQMTSYGNGNFSLNLKSLLLSYAKVVHTSNTATASYSSKYHIASANELNFSAVSGSTMTSLGSDTYTRSTFFKNLYIDPMLTRSRLYFSSESAYNEALVQGQGTLIVGMEIPDSTTAYWGIAPIINISGNTPVKYLRSYNGTSIYAIDWSGTSSTKIFNVPLGSIIYDLDGVSRVGE